MGGSRISDYHSNAIERPSWKEKNNLLPWMLFSIFLSTQQAISGNVKAL
jgi:hypothetical protein